MSDERTTTVGEERAAQVALDVVAFTRALAECDVPESIFAPWVNRFVDERLAVYVRRLSEESRA